MRRAGVAALVLLALAPLRVISAQSAGDRTPAAVAAARAALRALPDSTRTGATFSFDSTERSNWFYVPIERKGVTLARMTAEARARVDSLLLSDSAQAASPRRRASCATRPSCTTSRRPVHLPHAASCAIPTCTISACSASRTPRPLGDGASRVTIFGELHGMGSTAPIVSPVFFGANPAKVPAGPHAGLRILAAEEDLARELVKMLDARQRAVAVFSDTALVEIETRNDPKARALKSEGLRAADMTAAQRAQFRRLLDHYAGRVSATARAHALRDVEEGGFGELRFAWAGGTDVGQAHYYRIHGPTILVEYDNQQTNANHIHTVWRDLRHDFGGDLLAEHYRKHKHASPSR
jgi:hypothetical protein